MKKERWPEFPFSHWTMKPTLENIACHLDTQSHTHHSSGFTGEPSPMEKQIIEHLSSLEQQVAVHNEVVQALMQIIDDQRPSQRARRMFRWVREKVKCYEDKRWVTIAFKILGVLGALGTLWYILTLLVRLFHFAKR